MARSKLTPDQWAALHAAYDEWDPSNPDAPSIDDLCAEHGISKATFYYERRRLNLPRKSDRGRTATSDTPLVDILVREIQRLRGELALHR